MRNGLRIWLSKSTGKTRMIDQLLIYQALRMGVRVSVTVYADHRGD